MRCPLVRSRSLTLIALTLGIMPWTNLASARGQEARPPAASDSRVASEKRIEELETTIGQHLAAGRIAQAIPAAREKLDLCIRLRGKDHWQTADARRDLETYERLAARPREARDRFAEARRQDARAEQLYSQGQYNRASELCQKTLAIDREVLGEDHLLTATSYNNLALTLFVRSLHADAEAMHRRALAIRRKALGEGHPDTAVSYENLAISLSAQGKYPEAEAMHRQVLATRQAVLGELNPATAKSYGSLASTLFEQGKYPEAEAMFRQALAITLKVRGEGHSATATRYNDLAATLLAQGKNAEAEAMQRQALAIYLKTLGEGHPSTAVSYDNLAAALSAQWKLAEAEATNRRALSIFLKALGEGHPDTAVSYDALAGTLLAQGKNAEAQAMNRRALAIYLKTLGEGHPDTARTYGNLAAALSAQGDQAEAEAMLRRSLAIRLKALGEGHPSTAASYDNLALTLLAQGKSTEAEAMHRRALAIHLKALGEGHPSTATSYDNLAAALSAQGKHAEAEAIQRQALAIFRRSLGEGHFRTAQCYGRLAASLDAQGKHDEALRTWTLAAASSEQSRLFGPKGLESGLRAGSPLPGLAAALAVAGRPRDAWSSWERGLARGIVDEVTRRANRPLTAEERVREADLLGRGQAVDERINRMLGARVLTQDQEKTLEDLRQQASKIRRDLLDLEREFEASYGALASRPAPLEEAQKALPEGTALVGWIDTKAEHWACLLGHSGDPVWVRLRGSDKQGAWTSDEEELAQGLRVELNPETTRGKAGPLAESLARLRLDPLKKHLIGVGRLVVVNSPGLAGVPVEVLMAARPDPAWDRMTVSYAPSASMFAYLVGRPVHRDRPATFLALADPSYPEPKDDALAPEPPAVGLALARVVPNGNADLNGIREGDILLSYAGTALKQAGDLKAIASDGGPKKVPVRYWREGVVREAELAAGRLGVAFDPQPASGVRTGSPRSHMASCSGCAAGRTPGCPAPAARSRPSPASSPRAKPSPSWAPRRARRPFRAWPARASSRATATCTSPPTASRTRAAPTARP